MAETPNKPRRVGTRGDERTDVGVPVAPAMRATIATPPPARLAHADDAALEAGTTLGEYRIESKIGEGGMGVVYSAIHPLIGKRAAVKVLKGELCREAFAIERFIDEARVVNQIGHPNIVDVFAFGQTPDGRSYFVMEWLKGESLRERIDRDRLDLDEVCAIVKPLARALEAAHEQGVIHRDLKPDNVFLVDVRGEDPLVKLLDFGIAKLAREEHRMERTATGAMVGTPLYIAPEQAKGYAIDRRADIYSLGGILFELLTGRPPFLADNAMEVVAKHLMEPPSRPSAFAYVPPELDELVYAMLSKDPDARPALAEVATVLERTAALDRTNVKTPVAPVSALPGPVSEVIDAPLPSPSSSLTAQLAIASAPVEASSKRRGLLIGGVVLASAVASFFIVSSWGGSAKIPQPTAPPSAAPPNEPAVVPTPAVTETPPPPAETDVKRATARAPAPAAATATTSPEPPRHRPPRRNPPKKVVRPKRPDKKPPAPPPIRKPEPADGTELLPPKTLQPGGR